MYKHGIRASRYLQNFFKFPFVSTVLKFIFQIRQQYNYLFLLIALYHRTRKIYFVRHFSEDIYPPRKRGEQWSLKKCVDEVSGAKERGELESEREVRHGVSQATIRG